VPDNPLDLGQRISTHGISPVYLQRGAFIAVLSFAFFLAMMFGFYVRQSLGYFILASAFLLVYLFTLFSWYLQRKNQVAIYENGFRYKTTEALWSDIKSVEDSGRVTLTNGAFVEIPHTINEFDGLIRAINFKASSHRIS
jgi:hypothetical protein